MGELRVIVLAAGSTRQGKTSVLRDLGGRKVIDYITDNVRRLTKPERTSIVVAQGSGVPSYLGESFNYVVQREQRGTAHAVLQARSVLEESHGTVVVLYGDTPMLRSVSLRGLLNRHRLSGADLTLLTAVAQNTRDYGRVVRDKEGRITEIVEASDAEGDVADIRELNVGAYAAEASTLLPALDALAGEELRFTDCVRGLIEGGARVSSHAIYDEDEILGIDRVEDLEHAEFILEKRILKPLVFEDDTHIRFGLGGWRAIIGGAFTLENVRRVAQALANHLIAQARIREPSVVIGYDRRFLSDHAALAAAEVFAANNVLVRLLPEPAPTPLVTYATVESGADFGLMFTASHNPSEYNGLKLFLGDGALFGEEETQRTETDANALDEEGVVRLDHRVAGAAGRIVRDDFTNSYVDAVEAEVDMAKIRTAGLRVAVDPMFGVGKATLEIVLTEARCRVTTIHERHDPLFGGRSPAPDLRALSTLMTVVRDGDFDLGLATDGDADRIALVDENGEYVDVNLVLLLLYYHLYENRGQQGPVVRNLATTHLLDRLANHYGQSCIETPVGFRHVVAAMQEHDAVLGGESSGGLTVKGHILGKDGILAAALLVELVAVTGKTVSELVAHVQGMTGVSFTAEENVPATPDMKVVVPKRLAEAPVESLGDYRVQRVSHMDGVKLDLEGGHWVLLRFSGTEPLLRIMSEADTRERAQELIALGRELAGL